MSIVYCAADAMVMADAYDNLQRLFRKSVTTKKFKAVVIKAKEPVRSKLKIEGKLI